MGELDFGGNPIQLYEPEELIELQMNFSHDLQNMKRDPEWKDDLDCCPAIISPDATHGGILKVMEDFQFALLKIDCVF